MYTASSGTIDYPEGNKKYEHNLNCNFTIKSQENVAIKFRFLEFDFEGNYVTHNYDWLKIYDANNKKIGEYAMDELPPTDWKEIESNVLIIWLKTDDSTAKGGFKMEWEFVVDGDENYDETTTTVETIVEDGNDNYDDTTTTVQTIVGDGDDIYDETTTTDETTSDSKIPVKGMCSLQLHK